MNRVLVGGGALILLVAIVVTLLASVGLMVYAFFDSGAWEPLLGFAVAAIVIAGISIGLRSGNRA